LKLEKLKLEKLKLEKLKLREDEGAQIIILFGFLIAASLIVLSVLLNTVLFSGQQAAQGEFTFPKYEIQDIKLKTLDQAKIAANLSGFRNETIFNEIIELYGNQILALYSQRGAYALVTVKPVKSGENITWAQVKFIYNDMYTDYKSVDVIYDLKEE
jgi:hypothetical protein